MSIVIDQEETQTREQEVLPRLFFFAGWQQPKKYVFCFQYLSCWGCGPVSVAQWLQMLQLLDIGIVGTDWSQLALVT